MAEVEGGRSPPATLEMSAGRLCLHQRPFNGGIIVETVCFHQPEDGFNILHHEAVLLLATEVSIQTFELIKSQSRVSVRMLKTGYFKLLHYLQRC